MFRTLFTVLLFTLYQFSTSAIANDFDGVTCEKTTEALPLVVMTRDINMSKNDAIAMLPPKDSPLKKLMLIMTEEFFENTDISSSSYMHVKTKQCLLEKAGKPSKSINEVKSIILSCQSQFGTKSTPELDKCLGEIPLEKQ